MKNHNIGACVQFPDPSLLLKSNRLPQGSNPGKDDHGISQLIRVQGIIVKTCINPFQPLHQTTRHSKMAAIRRTGKVFFVPVDLIS